MCQIGLYNPPRLIPRLLVAEVCVTCMYSLNYLVGFVYTTVEFHGCTLFGVLRKIK